MTKLYIFILLLLSYSCKKNTYSNNLENAAIIDTASIFEKSMFNEGKIKIDTAYINNFKDEKLKSFYENFDNETVWESKKLRNDIIQEIENIHKDGLLPEDYNYSEIKNFENKIDDLSDTEKIEYDLLLTRSLQRLTNHLNSGKLNPKYLYNDVDLKEKKIDVNEIIFESIENKTIKSSVENCKPKQPVYSQLKKCLSILNNLPDDEIGYIPMDRKIKPNQKTNTIINIKKRLIFWEDLKKDTIEPNSTYDKETQKAVKKFQARHGLVSDGIIGRTTLVALNFTKQQRIQQVIANLERWRWYPDTFENHYILVNIPNFSMVIIKNKDTTQRHNVVVGKELRRTPVLSSKLNSLVLNPNWTVPPTILKEDIYPDAIKNRNVFRKKGLTILDHKNREVNPYSWKMEDAKKYRYVQKPGINSALGSMKLNFPNRFSVYLHDTNHRDLFSQNFRSLSSGCVRVEKPLELAEYILDDKKTWNMGKIKEKTNEKDPKTITLKIPDEIFVHQLYWTAWEDKNILNFRNDIYCLDFYLYSKLQK